MGSFAFSLHVKNRDTRAVAAAVETLLRGAGYQTTEQEPKCSFGSSMGSSLRAVRVAEAHEGWVGVLDSDLGGAETLAADLSRELGTEALFVFVNDSSSWHYELYRSGEKIDEFGSAGDEDDFDEEDDDQDAEMGGAMLNMEQVGALQQQMSQLMPQLFQQIETAMPPDIAALRQRVTTGQATPAEMQRYQQWVQAEWPRLMPGLLQSLGLPQQVPGAAASLFSGTGSQAGAGPTRDSAELNEHLEHLRPFLRPGATDAEVLEILGEQSIFAEQTLARFLPLLAIAELYANLSYGYLEEAGEAALRRNNIRLVEHLRYRRGPGVIG